MVILMNKKYFIEELHSKTKFSEEKCILINEILEQHFIIGKNNKVKILNDLKDKLDISFEEAENIYDISMSIILNSLKNKITHPFKSQD